MPIDAADPSPNEKLLVRRTAAFAIDQLAAGGLAMVLGAPFSERMPALGPHAWIGIACVWIAYFTLGDGPVGRGTTLGKRLLGIRVIDRCGAPPSPRAALLRALLVAGILGNRSLGASIVLLVPALQHFAFSLAFFVAAALGHGGLLLSPLVHPQGRGLADFATDTRVVRQATVDTPRPLGPRRASCIAAVAGMLGFFALFLPTLLAMRSIAPTTDARVMSIRAELGDPSAILGSSVVRLGSSPPRTILRLSRAWPSSVAADSAATQRFVEDSFSALARANRDPAVTHMQVVIERTIFFGFLPMTVRETPVREAVAVAP